MTDEAACAQAVTYDFDRVRHLFICTNQVAGGKAACGLRGGRELLAAVHTEALRRGLPIRVTGCMCLGACFDGPTAVVYPDAVWYRELVATDAAALVDHVATGAVLAAKQTNPPGDDQ